MIPRQGKNISEMAAVAINIGSISSRALSRAASLRLLPKLRWFIYPSIVIMESSTIIPSTTISAASDTVFSSILVRYITARAMAVHTGTPELAIAAERKGKSISITPMTTSMDIRRSLRNENTERPTTRG